MLKMADTSADTPLHHCARSGQASACKALLRLTMVPNAMNADDMLPEDVAAQGKHDVVADLLCRAREAGNGSYVCDALRHADGLGTLQEPPPGVVFTGLQEAESLRSAV